ncbi:MAG: hypothetical protein K0S93_1991, partial [Nitrososphaeraceae archaeon]|nr:hypothetical protein [Nitrososphaeraceae archaeon]
LEFVYSILKLMKFKMSVKNILYNSYLQIFYILAISSYSSIITNILLEIYRNLNRILI